MKKSIVSVLLVITLLFSCNTALLEGNTPQEKLDYGIWLLERYLTSGGKDELVTLADIISQFDSVGAYGQSNGFLMYATMLQCVENNNYNQAEIWKSVLQLNTSFKEYIEEESFANAHLGILSVDALLEYCQARKLEHEGKSHEAMNIYAKYLNFYDAMDRCIDISMQLNQTPDSTPTPKPTPTPSPTPDVPVQAKWSEWAADLPSYVTDKYFDIEERTLYRSRELQTTSSTTEKEKKGWTLYDTAAGNGDFGAWSDWAAEAVKASDTREVETQTRYRYRDKETTTSSSSSKSGWELTDTTYSWSNYGSWSSWSTTAATKSDSRKVESKTQYRYRDLEKTTSSSSSMSGWTYYDTTTNYGSWSSWGTSSISASNTLQVESKEEYQYTKYYMAHYCTGNVSGAQYKTASSNNTTNSTFNSKCTYHSLGWYDSLSSFTLRDDVPGGYKGSRCSNTCYTWYIMDTDDVYKTYYRSRSISYTYHFQRYGSWSDWSDTAASSSSTREVETRTVYRYCDREKVPTYHFARWTDWSKWSTKYVEETNTRDVKYTTYYRYRDRQYVTTYYFKRWGEWSDYSTQEMEASDTVDVQSKKQYRFISKSAADSPTSKAQNGGALQIISQPSQVIAAIGADVIIEMQVSGAGLSYQWYVRNPGKKNFSESSITESIYRFDLTEDKVGREVYSVITDKNGDSVTSDVIAIKELKNSSKSSALKIVSQPVQIVAQIGETVSVEMKVKGNSLSYKWFVKNPGKKNFTESSATDSAYSFELTEDKSGREVYCTITDGKGNSVTSEVVTITAK